MSGVVRKVTTRYFAKVFATNGFIASVQICPRGPSLPLEIQKILSVVPDVIAQQSEEIAELKASVADLYREVAILQEKTKTSLTGAQKVEGSKTCQSTFHFTFASNTHCSARSFSPSIT